MKPTLLITTLLLIYQSANNFKHSSQVDILQHELNIANRQIKHLESQIQKANDQVEEWNKNYLAKDYAKRNNITPLSEID
jgi:predicted  nucleic acid-binding Zn-ribbon protein